MTTENRKSWDPNDPDDMRVAAEVYRKIKEEPPALNDYHAVRRALEALDIRYDEVEGWHKVTSHDRASVAVQVVAHMGGNPTDMRVVRMIDGFLSDMQEAA